jgi:hypothetical protein
MCVLRTVFDLIPGRQAGLKKKACHRPECKKNGNRKRKSDGWPGMKDLSRTLRRHQSLEKAESEISWCHDDARQHIPFKANAEVRFADPGDANGHDTRQDHPAKA